MSEPPAFSPTITLLTIARAWESALTEGLAPLGLTVRRYGLLGHIRSTPDISFSELARRSRITVQSAHTAVAGFTADGLVEVVTEQVGAASRIRVTATGRELLDRAAEVVGGLDADLEAADAHLAEALRASFTRRFADR
ncbi:MarR family winged helix-turn-helix transcriptional regulator [Desertihabitans aurantiacus]|uniref:MarR family winged helix-turn-helix transcriptional regulator n=1 Tax=Desertihabitans aurantiacus TaxID=2282477 RepID=UPI000DF7B915|nr:MarR family winged helix-turn-helix transcriptional regulator [Desertihabitans aurantiacus]